MHIINIYVRNAYTFFFLNKINKHIPLHDFL